LRSITLGNVVHKHERVHVIAAKVRHGQVAVGVVDTVGQAQQEREEAVAVVETPPDALVGWGGGALAVEALRRLIG
jgi:hypothetical protein